MGKTLILLVIAIVLGVAGYALMDFYFLPHPTFWTRFAAGMPLIWMGSVVAVICDTPSALPGTDHVGFMEEPDGLRMWE